MRFSLIWFRYQLAMLRIRVLIGLSRRLHCSNCIWNRYCQNHRSILPNFLLFAGFDTHVFIRLPCSNKKMYEDAVFADRFRYQLVIFGIHLLIGQSRLLDIRIAYETDGAKMIAAFWRISCCLHDFIRLNSIVCHVQRARCTTLWFSMIDSGSNWLCLKCIYWYGYLDSLILILNRKQLYIKITTYNWLDAWNDLSCRTVVKR